MKNAILKTALEKGLASEGLSFSEALSLVNLPDVSIYELLSVTEQVRRRHKGVEVNLCSIVNAKSGLCKEDCSFCAQSARYSTGVKEYPFAEPDEIVRAAAKAAENGAREFSIVTSGSRVEKEKDVAKLIEALKKLKDKVSVERCASLGMLSRETLGELKRNGLQSYHHNLETSRGFFPRICSTHEYDADVEAVRTAKELGFYVCSGGLFGLGESWEDRAELCVTLRELDVDSIPVNFLNPRPGTPMEGAANLTPLECLKIIALIRLMLPEKDIVVCGGRQVNLRDLQSHIFAAGASGMMIGDYLTTPGRQPKDDLQMIRDLGLRPKA